MLLEVIKKFVVDHKEEFIRGACVVGGGLIGIIGAAIAVKSDEPYFVDHNGNEVSKEQVDFATGIPNEDLTL